MLKCEFSVKSAFAQMITVKIDQWQVWQTENSRYSKGRNPHRRTSWKL